MSMMNVRVEIDSYGGVSVAVSRYGVAWSRYDLDHRVGNEIEEFVEPLTRSYASVLESRGYADKIGKGVIVITEPHNNTLKVCSDMLPSLTYNRIINDTLQ